MNKQLLILIVGFLSLALVSASVTFAVIHVTTTVSVSEPISPLSKSVTYSVPPSAPPQWSTQLITITNAASDNRTLNVTFTETSRHPGCGSANLTFNMPMIVNVTSGVTSLSTMMTHNGPSPVTGCSVQGIVNIARI